jgi:hypothetical protein
MHKKKKKAAMLPQSEIDAIKSISITDFLHRQNVPSKRVGKSLFFSAPFRNDSNPSLKVDERTNRWHDFGTGNSGDIIDLVRMMNSTDFAGAIQVLRTQSGLNIAFPPLEPTSSAPAITVLSVAPIYHKGLLDYLHERNIDVHIAKQNCKQVNYRVNDKTYFALGFKNDCGGYELSNKYFKGCTKKDISTINPRINEAGDGSQCLVFEGFMDYLSYLTINKRKIPHGWVESPNDSVVVLNSVANLQKAKPFIEQQRVVNTFLDNDAAGQRAAQEIARVVKSGHPVWNASQCYQQHKDLNAYLMSLPRQRCAISKSIHY